MDFDWKVSVMPPQKTDENLVARVEEIINDHNFPQLLPGAFLCSPLCLKFALSKSLQFTFH